MGKATPKDEEEEEESCRVSVDSYSSCISDDADPCTPGSNGGVGPSDGDSSTETGDKKRRRKKRATCSSNNNNMDTSDDGSSTTADKGGIHSCDQCDKTFGKLSSLARHKYEHSGCAIYQLRSLPSKFA